MMVETRATARVLVAEDDLIVARDIAEALEGLGYEVAAHVSSGEQAVEAAQELDVDLVLMDVRMPGHLDGIEAAHRIGSEHDVPVVYLTAYSDDRTVARAKDTSPFGYLVKPFDQRELKTTVELALYRHRMERMVRDSRQRYRELFEDDIAGHYVATPDGKVLAANRAFARLVGAESVDEVLDFDAGRFYSSPEAREAFLQEIRARGSVESKLSALVRLDGTPVSVLHGARGKLDDHGRLAEIHGSVADMSRERALEERLRRSARMEAVARLAGGIAHDFRNLLTGIRGSVELVLQGEDLRPEGVEDLETVLEACDRARTLVRGLLSAGGGEGSDREIAVDMSATVRGTADVLGRLMDPGRSLRVRIPDEPLLIRGTETQLEQVVMNLMMNAADALPERGGEVRVEVDEVPGEQIDSTSGEEPPDRWIRVTVSDTGEGMDEETRERIFDPFYTTKDGGTGLGLAVVYGIVRDHGGEIVVDSEPGEGTTFQVYLPRAGARGTAGASPSR